MLIALVPDLCILFFFHYKQNSTVYIVDYESKKYAKIRN